MKLPNLVVVVCLVSTAAPADNIYVAESGLGRVGKYSTSGAAINPSLITGLTNPRDMRITSSGNLLVTSAGAGVVTPSTIGLYTTSGQTLNAALTSTLSVGYFYWSAVLVGTNLVAIVQNSATDPSFSLVGASLTGTNSSFLSTYSKYSESVVSDGTYFYVLDSLFGHIQKFSSAGAALNYDLVTAPTGSSVMTIDGTNLYAAFNGPGYIAKYSTSGQVISTNLISGLSGPWGVAADGHGHLFVANNGNGTVGEYGTDGSVINSNLITGLNAPWAITVETEAPALGITQSNNTVYVTWPAITNFFLQTNHDLSVTNWGTDTNFSTSNGTNLATITPPEGALFFRLKSTNGY